MGKGKQPLKSKQKDYSMQLKSAIKKEDFAANFHTRVDGLTTIGHTQDRNRLLMNYPADIFFDIETLINVAQPQRILLLGDCDSAFLNSYLEQKALLNQACDVVHIKHQDISQLWELPKPFDVAIAVGLFEHIDKKQGMRVLSRLRDVLSPQYCICLPIAGLGKHSEWQLTDLFSFALSKVASYQSEGSELGLFKYNISDYKKTPDWLNADNWANPDLWGKYWW